MKPINISLIFLVFLFQNNIFSQSATIYGQIEGYKNKKLVLSIKDSGPVGIFLETKTIKLKTNSDGCFEFYIDSLYHTILENELKIGSNTFYLMISPNDSIFLDIIHEKENYTLSHRSSGKILIYNDVITDLIENNTLRDYNWLVDQRKKIKHISELYNIDEESIRNIDQSMLCFFFHYCYTPSDYNRSINTIPNKACSEEFSLDNQYLLWNYLYYSVINGYLSIVDSSSINFNDDGALISFFNRAEEYLDGQWLENYKAYTIAYSVVYDPRIIRNKGQIQNRQLVSNFLSNCQNDLIKLRLKKLMMENRITLPNK